MEYTKETVASNIALLRQTAGMTQADFAQKLNYTDKAISKWERAESIPDVFVLARIAELFGVTVDYLLTQHENAGAIEPPAPKRRYNHTVLSFLSVMPIWLVATVIYVAGTPFIDADKIWLCFVAAVPASLIVLLVCNCLWGKVRTTYLLVSLLIWTVLTFVFLLLLVLSGTSYWLFFLIGIPCQAAVLLWTKIIRRPAGSRAEKSDKGGRKTEENEKK